MPSGASKIVYLSDAIAAGHTLAWADATVAAMNGVLVIDQDATLTATTTLASKQIEFSGGIVTLAAYDLTCTGNAIVSGDTQIFDSTGVGKVKGWISGDTCIDWWGTTSTSTSDAATTNAGNDCLNFFNQSGKSRAVIYCGKKTYYLHDSWVKPSSFDCPDFEGRGAQLIYGFSAKAAIKIVGGSGALAVGSVSGFSFSGSSASWGLEVNAQCGVDVHHCYFGTNAWGLVLHNEGSGSFTEYVQWYSCSFDGACAQSWWYKISGGNQSFHGCGPREGVTVNTPAMLVGPMILLDTDAVVYNAPYNFQIWPLGNSYPIISAGSNSRFFVYGTITIENFSSGGITIMNSASGYAAMVGGFQQWNGYADPGSLVFMESMGILSNGVLPGFSKRRTVSATLGAGGGSVILKKYAGTDFLIKLQLVAPYYTYKYLLNVWYDPYGNSGVNILVQEEAFDQAAWYAPSFAWNGSALTISNSNYPANTVNASVSYIDMNGA